LFLANLKTKIAQYTWDKFLTFFIVSYGLIESDIERDANVAVSAKGLLILANAIVIYIIIIRAKDTRSSDKTSALHLSTN